MFFGETNITEQQHIAGVKSAFLPNIDNEKQSSASKLQIVSTRAQKVLRSPNWKSWLQAC